MPSVISLNVTSTIELLNNTSLNNKVVPAQVLRDFVTNANFGGLLSQAGTGSIPPAAIQPIGSTKILDNAVTTAKILNSNVTEAKLANSSVTTAKIDDSAVTTAKIANSSVTTDKINNLGVTTAKIADLGVTTAKLANASVTVGKISATGTPSNTTYFRGDGSWQTVVQPPNVEAGTGISVTVANNTATVAHGQHTGDVSNAAGSMSLSITNGAVTTAKIADSGVTTAKIADSGVTSAKIADSAVTTAKIANLGVTPGKLSTGAPTWTTAGNLSVAGTLSTEGNVTINNSSPTITLQDTNNRTGFIHVNADRFYILRGAVNDTTWDTGPNGRHPMTLNLENGNVVFSGNVTAFSDERLKKNIATIHNALDKTVALRGVTFERKETKDKGIGVIAQEVKKIIPEAVIEDEDGYMSVSYGNLVGLLIEAIKELNQKIEKLEGK